jgi:uncharacterized protein (UPF0303 family)
MGITFGNCVKTRKLLKREAKLFMGIAYLMNEENRLNVSAFDIEKAYQLGFDQIQEQVKKIVGTNFFMFNIEKQILSSDMPFILRAYQLSLENKSFEKTKEIIKLQERERQKT